MSRNRASPHLTSMQGCELGACTSSAPEGSILCLSESLTENCLVYLTENSGSHCGSSHSHLAQSGRTENSFLCLRKLSAFCSELLQLGCNLGISLGCEYSTQRAWKMQSMSHVNPCHCISECGRKRDQVPCLCTGSQNLALFSRINALKA